MNRLYHLLLVGTCLLILCMTGDCRVGIAMDKKGKKAIPVALVCKQVPLYPVSGSVWAWIAYKYEYDQPPGNCTTATTTSIIEYGDYEAYPESCGPACDPRFLPKGRPAAEPIPIPNLHKLPASSNARLDLYLPGSKLYCDQLGDRYFQFGTGSSARYARAFSLCVSKIDSPAAEQSDAVDFWYGFEVKNIPSNTPRTLLPYYHVKRRAKYIIEGNSGEGNCRELSLVNHGGTQYLIRFE